MSMARMGLLRLDLLRYARSLGAAMPDAEDVVSTAFVRGCEHAQQLEAMGDSELRAYCFRMVKNAWIDLLRKRRPETLMEEVHEGESVWDDVSGLYVEQMLDRLPRPLWECVYWRYVAGENSTQIAQRLSIPAATVRTRLRSAVMILRSIQKEEE